MEEHIERLKKLAEMSKTKSATESQQEKLRTVLGICVDRPKSNMTSRKRKFKTKGEIKESNHKNLFKNNCSCIYFSRSSIFY